MFQYTILSKFRNGFHVDMDNKTPTGEVDYLHGSPPFGAKCRIMAYTLGHARGLKNVYTCFCHFFVRNERG